VTGPFPEALRAAIQVRGLSLDRLRHHLKQRGTPISITALSYWQTGRRRPERPESLRALTELEDVLDLPRNALSRLLGPPKPRGRVRAAQPEPRATWDGSGLTVTGQRDRVETDEAGNVRGVRSRQVMQADESGVDRWVLCHDTGSVLPEITALRACRIGRVARERTNGVLVAELLFDETLAEGSSIAIEYELTYPPGTHEQTHFRRFPHRVQDYVLEIKFSRSPARCEQFASGAGVLGGSRPAVVDSWGYAHAAALDFGPGVFGMRWESPLPG
jgi:hypothetical protein